MTTVLTQAEADALIRMLKESLVESINFPGKGEKKNFVVQGDSTKDQFDIQLYRGKIAANKMNYGAIVSINKEILLELHVGETLKHLNPDGTWIYGSHWHIYKQKYGRNFAIPATDVNSSEFENNTIKFFKEFNIISPPTVVYQQELGY